MVFIREIVSLTPPANPNTQLETLSTYLELAKCGIKRYANSVSYGLSKRMLADEDAVSLVVHELMIADWRYDPSFGRTRDAWRGDIIFCAIKKYVSNNEHTLRPKSEFDENHCFVDEDLTTKSILQQESGELPVTDINLHHAIEQASLTPVQKQCIHLHIFEHMTFREIGTYLKFSYQNAKKHFDGGIRKVREAFDI